MIYTLISVFRVIKSQFSLVMEVGNSDILGNLVA